MQADPIQRKSVLPGKETDMSYTVAQVMSKMPEAFLAEKAAGLDVAIQFRFTGVEAGEWFATIKDGRCSVSSGTTPAPKLTVAADAGEFVKIMLGEMDGMQAFMQGRLKLSGDINLAARMMSMFKIR
jgi:putative sterol carrier protein